MEKDKRIRLQKNSRIVLRRPYVDKDGEKTFVNKVFIIENEINRGSSAICYNAYYLDENNNKIAGSLKEFYPYDFSPSPAFDLVRDESVDEEHNNQLYSKKGTKETFLKYKNGYVRPYNILTSALSNTNEDSDVIKDFNLYLPSYELYYGFAPMSEEQENCTVYVWVKNEPDFVTYKEVLDDVCAHMQDENYNRIKDLRLILNCILELSKCVDTLHLFSLYHLDLKPENFGIATFRSELSTNIKISLYDLNSLYSGRERDSVVLSSGTKYFRSPEVAKCNTHKFNPQSDVYSLGALLYYSLVMDSKEDENTDETKYYNVHFCEGKNEFDENEYNNIGVALRNSLFLRDTDETESSILFRNLYAILRKSLNTSLYHNNDESYETAEEFYRDISKVIELLKEIEGKIAIEQETDLHVENTFRKKEEYLATKNKNGATGVIQWLLYKYPLYNYCVHRDNEEDSCNALVLGGATYGSKFIDLAFELSQVKNCRLDITVVSNEAQADKATYLATRPAMEDFFEIDNIPAKRKELSENPYGRLSFVQSDFAVKNSRKLKTQIKDICLNNGKEYTYVFIALGNEVYNEKVALLCRDCLCKNENSSIVSYTVFDESKETMCILDSESKDDKVCLLQLSVFDSLEKHEEYKMLCRMAFNAHLTWSSDYINNMKSAMAKFRSKYNFNSSLENALSIKYKLHSINSDLDLDFSDPITLAAEVTKIVGVPGEKNSGYKPAIRELTMYEHRRWVVEKITNSWCTLTDVSQLHSDTKDKTNRLHPCIVPSESALTLSTQEWSSHKKWDTATEAEKESLDGLDRLSIEMHQHFLRESEKLRTESKALDYQEEIIKEIAKKNAFALCVYNDLERSVESLISEGKDVVGSVEKFKYYKKLLLGVKFPDDEKKMISVALKKIESILFPVIQAASYKNWKAIDENLIRSIPFILTYSSSLHLCVPFFAETSGNHDTTALFGNVASSLMLNPLYVTFIADGDIVQKEPAGFKKSLEYCSETLKNHGLQTSINMIILRKSTYEFDPEYIDELLGISEKIRSVDDIVYNGWNQVIMLQEFLSQKSIKFTAIELNDTRISGLLQSANELACKGDFTDNETGIFPMYTFDSAQQKFYTTDRCAFLTYVRNTPNLQINDLFYSRGKTIDFSEPELINEHEDLWKIYTGSNSDERNKCTSAWKELCGTINSYMEESNLIAKISVFCKNPEYFAEYSARFPAYCKETVDMIMTKLKLAKYQFDFFSDYSISRSDSKSFRLTVKHIRKDIADEIDNMLIQPMQLAEKSMVEVVLEPACVKISAFTLRVEKMKLPTKHTDRCLFILKRLSELGCIRSYTYLQNDNCVSFTFATEHHMQLLKKEGSILELHIYRKAIESGSFDDVKTGATVHWDPNGASNEMDIVLVSGFNTFIVECKATRELEPGFYDKLYPLGKTFGVNNVPIIVADLDGKKSPKTIMQISRGEELGIKTIIKAEDPIPKIKNILKEKKN